MTIFESIAHAKEQLKRNFYWIFICAAIGGGLAYYLASKKTVKYKSYSKIFPLGAEGGSSLSGLAASIGLGGSEGNSISRHYNVSELVKSRNISRTIVTNNAGYGEDKRVLYEAMIEDYNKGISDKSRQIKLSKNKEENIATAAEILKEYTVITPEKSEFTKIECTAHKDSLALHINNCILAAISDFYIQSKTEKARHDLDKIANLRDSLKDALDAVEKALLDFGQRTKYLTDSTALLPRIKLERLRGEVALQYAAATESHQNANFMLLSQSPIFQILDKPSWPLERIDPPIKQNSIFGVAAGLLVGLFIALRKTLGKIISSELKSL
ncbi:MAG: hypothetical protein RL660_2461 [Bacteroidota bacterium]|jgi:uncharacterized protein involved in exopolysaccharide biosynthesis